MIKKFFRNKKSLKNKKFKTKKVLKKNKKGGANCPRIGYSQHFGECWHDSISIALLYSDVLGDYHQKLFNDPTFNIESIIDRDGSEFNKKLMPINIDDKDYDRFKTLSRGYIKSLYERYNNDKLPTTKELMKISSKRKPMSSGESWASVTRKHSRRDSTSMSLRCVEKSFNIAEINNINPIIYTDDNHRGTLIHYYSAVATINYFLTSHKRNKYIDMGLIDLYDLIKGSREEIIGALTELKNKISSSHAISLSLQSETEGHAVSLITCDGKNYFYDDNGIDDYNNKLSVEFDWKKEFDFKLDAIITYYRNNTYTIESLILALSDFLNGKRDLLNRTYNGNIGREYLKDYNIDTMYVLELKDIKPSLEQLQIIYDDKLLLINYNNARTINFVEKYLHLIKYDKIFLLLKRSILYNNSEIGDVILKHIISKYGINKQTSYGNNLLEAMFYKSKNNHDLNRRSFDLRKKYITQLINENLDFTTKNKSGNNILTSLINWPQQEGDTFILELMNFMISVILNKILVNTKSLDEYSKLLDTDFFKNLPINKSSLITKYKTHHKIK